MNYTDLSKRTIWEKYRQQYEEKLSEIEKEIDTIEENYRQKIDNILILKVKNQLQKWLPKNKLQQ